MRKFILEKTHFLTLFKKILENLFVSFLKFEQMPKRADCVIISDLCSHIFSII